MMQQNYMVSENMEVIVMRYFIRIIYQITYRIKNLEGISKKNSRRGIGKLEPVVSNVLILTAKGLHCLLFSADPFGR